MNTYKKKIRNSKFEIASSRVYNQAKCLVKAKNRKKKRREDIADLQSKILIEAGNIAETFTNIYREEGKNELKGLYLLMSKKFQLDLLCLDVNGHGYSRFYMNIFGANSVFFAKVQTKILEEISYYDTDILKNAITVGANLNIINERGHTILTSVLANRNFEAAELLLQNGVSINITDFSGRTALHHIRYEPDILKWLLEYNINVNKSDVYGKSALMYMAEMDLGNAENRTVVRSLIEAGAIVDEELKNCLSKQSWKVVDNLYQTHIRKEKLQQLNSIYEHAS